MKTKQAREAAQKVAVDQRTKDYFESYFMAYGAQLVRDLAFKKVSRKLAQADVLFWQQDPGSKTYRLVDSSSGVDVQLGVYSEKDDGSFAWAWFDSKGDGQTHTGQEWSEKSVRTLLEHFARTASKQAQTVGDDIEIMEDWQMGEAKFHKGDKYKIRNIDADGLAHLYGDIANKGGMDMALVHMSKLDGSDANTIFKKMGQSESMDDLEFGWGPDEDADISWMSEEDKKDYRDGNLLMLSAWVRDPADGQIYDSLGGIAVHSENDPYLQVELRKEMMDEAKANFERQHGKQSRQAQAFEEKEGEWLAISSTAHEKDYESGAHAAVEYAQGAVEGVDAHVYKATLICPDGRVFEEECKSLDEAMSYCEQCASAYCTDPSVDAPMSYQEIQMHEGKIATQTLKAMRSTQKIAGKDEILDILHMAGHGDKADEVMEYIMSLNDYPVGAGEHALAELLGHEANFPDYVEMSPAVENKLKEDLKKILGMGKSAQSNVTIHWSKELGSDASEDEIAMQDAQIELEKQSHPGSEGGVLFPEETPGLDGNYAAVWSPADADMGDVAAALMSQ